ncbi:MAG: bifunctional (p)ppGpp synthetase/guanosine-3',5'-bis(diphosphate) 3'-pyrophosphohydrolase [Saprospiraceae bacterium]|nr:bifunctional (p)ppGpp synthetase/guanosine-3',5'-bis(diphosphate) 3'-pyrophosphohydrolase [Saprospiraceae bacterium]
MAQDKLTPHIPADDRPIIQRAYRNLLKSIKTPLNTDDSRNIRAAFELAAQAHQEQRRKSGEPYILHPIEVARICVEEIGLGPTAVVCALLHDVVEDTDVTLKDVHRQFGDRVALIVDGLTKLDSLHDSESPQAENLAKVLRNMLVDVRVVLIKMADRLHNLRTIRSMAPHKQLKIAAETSTIYAPLAHRLGLYKIKSEFQDICLKITHPEEYHDIADKLAQTKRARQQYIDEFVRPISAALEEFGIKARITGRPKSIFSIWNKIRTKHVAFEDIYDLFAIRIITDVPPEREKITCWQIYSFITDYYKPIPERLKDWVTTPKANGYESLHTTVIGPDGRFVEVQIRSNRMDEIAERGFAAHWKYKGIKGVGQKANVFENWLNQVRETLEDSADGSTVEFLADFKTTNLFAEEIHVFTPKGEMKVLPEGATALDFAFSIHSDIGCACQAAKVNNKLVPISSPLHNGDQVQIITNKNQKPSEDWLQFVITAKAKNRIRSALKDERRKLAADGREILERKLQNTFKVPVEDNIDPLSRWFGYPNRLEFLSAIALEQVDLAAAFKRFRPDGSRLVEIEEDRGVRQVDASEPPTETGILKEARPSSNKAEIIINGEPGHFYAHSFATCCHPVQGDPIFAFVTTKEGVKIHRTTCPNAPNMLANYEYRILKADWGNTVKADFVADIVITGIDIGKGAIQRLTDRISNLGLNIRSFSISGEGGYFEGKVSLVVRNIDQLNHAMLSLKSFDWVSNVRRAE